MANVQVRVRIDHGKMQAVVGDLSRAAVLRAGEKTRQRYVQNIASANLWHTGYLQNSVTMVDAPLSNQMHPRVAIGTPAKYAKYHEYGTRAHGPVRASRLRFKPKGSAKFVYAKWVRGVPAQKFALRALDSLRPTDFEP